MAHSNFQGDEMTNNYDETVGYEKHGAEVAVRLAMSVSVTLSDTSLLLPTDS